MDPLIIPIRDRRVKIAERMDLLFGHGVAAFGLVAAAMDALPGTNFVAVQGRAPHTFRISRAHTNGRFE